MHEATALFLLRSGLALLVNVPAPALRLHCTRRAYAMCSYPPIFATADGALPTVDRTEILSTPQAADECYRCGGIPHLRIAGPAGEYWRLNTPCSGGKPWVE
jgi:hypothetical protein